MKSRIFHFTAKIYAQSVAKYGEKHYLCNAFSGNAAIAQSVERFTRNEKVAGSIPACGSQEDRFSVLLFLFYPTSKDISKKALAMT